MIVMNESVVYEDLRDKLISRADAIELLMDMRYCAEDAQCIVDEWIGDWEYEQDWAEEREQGWG